VSSWSSELTVLTVRNSQEMESVKHKEVTNVKEVGDDEDEEGDEIGKKGSRLTDEEVRSALSFPYVTRIQSIA
jgi:hypothetical protein